jgi:hypothetical protein
MIEDVAKIHCIVSQLILLVESDWAYSKFGSGEMTIRYGDETYDLWFNQ